MIYQKYIARCYRVYQHERNENASFLSIFNGGGRPKWRFSNFPGFWKNASALGSFNCIFENNSLNALFGQNMKKLKIFCRGIILCYLARWNSSKDKSYGPYWSSFIYYSVYIWWLSLLFFFPLVYCCYYSRALSNALCWATDLSGK